MQITQTFIVDTPNIADGAVTVAKVASSAVTDTLSASNPLASANYAAQMAMLFSGSA